MEPDPDPTRPWSPQPDPGRPRPPEPDATQAWSQQPPAQQPAQQSPAQQSPGQPPAPQAWAPESDATQAWSAEPPPGGPEAWSAGPGPGDRQGAEAPGSIVPDSWFSGPPQPPPQPEAPERWTPQPEQMHQDPWGQRPPADATPAWGAQVPGGMPPMPHQETAMMATGFPPHDGPGHPPGDYAPGDYAQGDYQQGDYQQGDYRQGEYQQGEYQQNRASKPLIFAVAGLVAVALIAVGLVMWPDGGEKPAAQRTPAAVKSTAKAANPAARQQAAAVNSLLNASAASRGELGRALASAKRCKGLPAAIGGMQRVAQQRQQQFNRAQSLKVDALSNGTQLRSHLARSFQLSLDVDRAYLSWAQRARGCKGRPKGDANYQRGGQLSNQATVSKQRFAVLWTPVAKEQRLRPRTANQF